MVNVRPDLLLREGKCNRNFPSNLRSEVHFSGDALVTVTVQIPDGCEGAFDLLLVICARQHGYFLLAGVNRIDQDEPAQVGKDQKMTILREMNDLQQLQDDV